MVGIFDKKKHVYGHILLMQHVNLGINVFEIAPYIESCKIKVYTRMALVAKSYIAETKYTYEGYISFLC